MGFFFKRNRFALGFLLAFTVFLPATSFASSLKNKPSIAIDYGANVPINVLHSYNVVAVQPYSNINPKTYNTKHSQAFAYVSIGEIDKNTEIEKQVPKSWIIGYNKIWDAKVVDETNPQWQLFFVNKIITPLWNRGFRGFLFDTMDSFQLVAKTKEAQEKQVAGLIKIIRMVKAKYPDAKIILNRGFEVLPEVHQDIYALVAESLFETWDNLNKRYEKVSPEEHKWLLNQLNIVQDKYHIPVLVMDYVPPNNYQLAQQTAEKIKKLGFMPWVADGQLTMVGVGAIQTFARDIYILYTTPKKQELAETDAFRFLAMPLEYFGYVPRFFEIEDGLPNYILNNRVAGIIVWSDKDSVSAKYKLIPWLKKQMQARIPILFFSNFGFKFTPANSEIFGISEKLLPRPPKSVAIVKQSPLIGYEIKPYPNPYDFKIIKTNNANVLLKIKDNAGQTSDVVALTKWGGYALAPYVIKALPNDQTRWVINPLQFLRQGLRLKTFPIPDTTTENGNRIMLVHIDGDAFISQSEWFKGPVAAKSIEDKILKKYRIPTTVSVIEGEISRRGVKKENHQQLEAIARSIFKLPWVEIASHSFSHPFDWVKIENVKTNRKGYMLPIKNYKYNVNAEITGSVDYINKNLAPPGKKVKVYLWTGAANPTEQAVALSYKDGLMNMNGGDTIVTNDNISLTNIGPLGIFKGPYYQVFAPIMNENIFTNDWLGPFYGFRRVIETFKITNKPYRFKPIDIYYHYYSGSKVASLKALEDVYDWALKQNVINLYVSQYSHIALDFIRTSIGKRDGSWLISNRGHLRELRVPKSLGMPNFELSKNVIGFSPYGNDYYVHLGPKQFSVLTLQSATPTAPYIYSTNGFVRFYQRDKNDILLNLQSYVKLKFVLANVGNCKVTVNDQAIKAQSRKGNLSYYNFDGTKIDALKIRC